MIYTYRYLLRSYLQVLYCFAVSQRGSNAGGARGGTFS